MCSNENYSQRAINSPNHKRHPILSRQLEQDETQPVETVPSLLTVKHGLSSNSPPVNSNSKYVMYTTHNRNKSPSGNELRPPGRHPLPPAQESQGSGSTGSGITVMSIGTSVDGSSSSSKSAREGSKMVRGALCSSSASSSTEETEARERRFGSVDLHPLPQVAPAISALRRSWQVTSHQQLQYLVLTALRKQMVRKAPASTDAQNGNKEISDEEVSTEEPPTTQGILNYPFKRLVDLNATQLFTLLPTHFWSCLLCPVHSISWPHSTDLLLNHLRAVKPERVRPTVETSVSQSTESISKSFSVSGSTDFPLDAAADKEHRIGPYQLGRTLGRGNFAVVKLAQHLPTKHKVAIKIVNKELIGPSNLSKVTRELEAMKRCQHPHIVSLYHVMESESNIFMVTEYASKGEVFDHISKSRAFSEKEARELFWQIVCAIDFCHNSGVVHRDLKAENLLLDWDLKVKVADFGFCNFFKPDELLSTHCGSPQYAAPELFKGEPYDGPLADVWSLGVILYILVCGSFPFPGESLGDIRKQVLRGLVRFPFFLSTSCEQVIRSMLQVDPARRYKLRQVINSPWMQASPNVLHYHAMMAKYENQAKDKQFDQVFEHHFPDHSELAKSDRARRDEAELDSNVLRALAVGAGFDETQVRLSTLQNKCDRFHAAYQLLLAKIRYFKRNSHLRQFVDDALRSTEKTSTNHRCSLAPVPDVAEEANGDDTGEPDDIRLTQTADTLSCNHSVSVDDKWLSRTQPGRVDFTVALIVLRADEDLILSKLGLKSRLVTDSDFSVIRRHTVQLTANPLKSADQQPRHQRQIEAQKADTICAEPHSTLSPTDESDGQVNVAPRSTSRRFPRQTTQPHIGGLRAYDGYKPEQLLQTALEWIHSPWKSETRKGLDVRNVTSRRLPMNMPSLELGQEAATTTPPVDYHKRPTLFRGDSIQESEDEAILDDPQLMTDLTGMLLGEAGNTSMELGNLPETSSSPPSPSIRWDDQVHDQTDFEQQASQQTRKQDSIVPNLSDEMDVTAPTDGADPSAYLKVDEDLDDVDECGLGTLLPQLNLPANVPVMMHQPVARFTVKDPHLLAPPEFMTPHSSSFPRRSSDGAAELQPLQRPTLVVGGSYPEQTNYRNLHSSSEADSSLLTTNPQPTTEGNVDPSQSSQTSSADSTTTDRGPSEPPPQGSAMTKENTVRSRTTLQTNKIRQATIHSLFYRRLPGKLPRYTNVSYTKRLSPFIGKSVDYSGQFDRHQKRFSLPVGCQSSELTSDGGETSNRENMCLCNRPLTPELVQQAQELLANWRANRAVAPVTLPDSHGLRRGSEASQMTQWQQRLNQYGGMNGNQEVEASVRPEPLSYSTLTTAPLDAFVFSESVPSVIKTNTSMAENSSPTFSCNAQPTSPPGIQMNELKSELHKLETEDRHISVSASQLGASAPSFVTSPKRHLPTRHQRVSSLKLSRRACSAVASGSGRSLSSRLHRRHRYSVGDRLDDPLTTDNLDLHSPTLMDSDTAHPMHLSLDYSQHRMVSFSLSYPDQRFQTASTNPVNTSVISPGSGRTAMSSPGSTPHPTPDFSTHGSLSPVKSGLSLSAGVKRRLLGVGQKQNYLHTLQCIGGGSLDRRFDFLSSPKRKLYQEWLPKVAAFSRKAAASLFDAVQPTAPTNTTSSDTTLHLTAATMSPASSVATSLREMDLDSDDQAEEEERDCALAPLQSQLPLTSRPLATNPDLNALLSTFGGRPPRIRTPSMVPFIGISEFQSHPWMFLGPASDDDDDDLAEIERVNQRLLLSGGVIESEAPFTPDFHPAESNSIYRTTPSLMGQMSDRESNANQPPSHGVTFGRSD